MSTEQNEEFTMNSKETDNENQSAQNGHDSEVMVHVSEAIKYRKRAQAAEQKLEAVNEKLHDIETQFNSVIKQQHDLEQDRELTKHLLKARVEDIDVAKLLIREKIQGDSLDGDSLCHLIEDMKKERPYLFCREESSEPVLNEPTAGLKRSNRGPMSQLQQYAKRAKSSGTVRDIQEYMRVRRSMSSS